MMRRNVTRGEGETRQKILAAAESLFLRRSYDAVSLRDIAAEVDVDVAYVHRCFGSKEQLFGEVLSVVSREHPLPAVTAADLPSVFAARMVDAAETSAFSSVDGLPLLLRSAMSATAAPLAAQRLEDDYILALQRSLGDGTPFRATAILSFQIGFMILSNLLQLPSVGSLGDGELRPLLEDALARLLDVNAQSDAAAS